MHIFVGTIPNLKFEEIEEIEPNKALKGKEDLELLDVNLLHMAGIKPNAVKIMTII